MKPLTLEWIEKAERDFSTIQRHRTRRCFHPNYAVKDVEPSADPDSPFWAGIHGVIIDKSILGPAVPQYRAEVRSRWTSSHVYFLFAGPYEKLTLKSNPDSLMETYRLWEKDCFEVCTSARTSSTSTVTGNFRCLLPVNSWTWISIRQNPNRVSTARTSGIPG